MSELYSKHAVKYDQVIQANIYNAMYDFPTMKKLIGEVKGKDIIDLGCGSGVYANYFVQQQAGQVTCIDYSAEMIELVKNKLGNRVNAYSHNVAEGLLFVADQSADLVVSALMIHYLEDLAALCQEVHRVLKQGGEFVFSTHHPFADFECSLSGNYFEREFIRETWDTVGEPVEVAFYRRSLAEITHALTAHGFVIAALSEGEVLEEAKAICEKTYQYLTTKPNFLFIQATKC
ncbi:class I SAM-dependent methyltransferase [Photobacterium leiognathi subsp. mandapamensis]|uniref:class I SAM-dependent methyltransferase n=1 Tax=Photobacterium leiognathi TaxID=553611 RepID=UPI003BF53928